MLHKIYSSSELEAYEAGKDCAVNGANTTNCHFTHFATPALTKAWEQGKANGESDRNSP
jgi:hypothetical protein